jgi:hypothetical protein
MCRSALERNQKRKEKVFGEQVVEEKKANCARRLARCVDRGVDRLV